MSGTVSGPVKGDENSTASSAVEVSTSTASSFAPAARRRLSLAHTVVVAVVLGCLAVPALLVGVAAVLADRAAVETQVARGQQLAMSAATLMGVARDSGSGADIAVLRAFMRAVVANDVGYLVVALPPMEPGGPPFILAVEAQTGLMDGDPYVEGLRLLQTPPHGYVVVNAAVQERDRSSGSEQGVGQVAVGVVRPGPPLRAVVGFLVAGICTALGVALVLVGILRRRLIRPLQLVTRGLKRVARGEVDVDVDDLRQPGARPPREIEALIDGFDALVATTRERGQLKARLQQGMGVQVAADESVLERPPSKADVAVLVVDIRDFTPLQASLTPEQSVALLDTLLSAMVGVVDRHGGHVERFLGDGLVALWGAPSPAADAAAAAAAIAAALDIEAVVATIVADGKKNGIPRFVVGIGVSWGSAVVGAVGPASRRFFAAMGEVPALARKVQQEAKSQGVTILVSEPAFLATTGTSSASPATSALLRHVSWKRLPPMVLRGVGMPVTLYRPERLARQNDGVTVVTRT